ncbi:MAG: hypothetical protein ABFC24_04795 [Methanoregulaceae archaeon]
MRSYVTPVLVILLLAGIASTGCMQERESIPTTVMSPGTPATASATAIVTVPAPPVISTPVTVTVTASPTSAHTYSPTASPTDVLPKDDTVYVQVNRNPSTAYPTITVVYGGGFSLGSVNEMDVTVVRSDGRVENKAVYNVVEGSSVTLMGTTATDRVIVWVTMLSGTTYKVYDGYSSLV